MLERKEERITAKGGGIKAEDFAGLWYDFSELRGRADMGNLGVYDSRFPVYPVLRLPMWVEKWERRLISE